MEKQRKNIAIALFVFLFLVTIASIVFICSEYLSLSKLQEIENLKTGQQVVGRAVKQDLAQLDANLTAAVGSCNSAQTLEELQSVLDMVERQGAIARYFTGDRCYTVQGSELSLSNESPEAWELCRASLAAQTALISYRVGERNLFGIGYYRPLDATGGNPATGLFVFYDVTTALRLSSLIQGNPQFEKAYSVLLCNAQGVVVQKLGGTVLQSEGGHAGYHGVAAPIVELVDAQAAKDVESHMQQGEAGVFSFAHKHAEATVAITPLDDAASLYLAAVYDKNALRDQALTMSYAMYCFLLFLVLETAGVVFFLFRFFRKKEEWQRFGNETFRLLGCHPWSETEKEAQSYFTTFPGTKFALILLRVNGVTFLKRQSGTETTNELLKNISNIFRGALQTSETYSYFSEGAFLLFFHYKERELLMSRLRVIATAVKKEFVKAAPQITTEVKFLIEESDREHLQSVKDMFDELIFCNDNLTEDDRCKEMVFCSDIVRSGLRDNSVSLAMKTAMENGEFQVFYQPQYDMLRKRIKGAEALVRWYNPQTNEYRRPDTFLPLFERNGFIVNLDKYVFKTVCQYLHEASLANRRIYPIAVNVSVKTALSEGFVEYYKATKERFGIPDEFITVEFTESIAQKNHLQFNYLIRRLREAGFHSSIDDFGTGYASYDTLKEITVDELKIDAVLLRRTEHPERDLVILRHIVDMAHELGIKVVQEGVETTDQVEMLKTLGCDTLQGYYYSKPLLLSDYITFIKNADQGSFHV